jgi:hypothetical protein
MTLFAARAPAECRLLQPSKVLYQWRAIKMRVDLRGPVPLVVPRLLPHLASGAERGALFCPHCYSDHHRTVTRCFGTACEWQCVVVVAVGHCAIRSARADVYCPAESWRASCWWGALNRRLEERAEPGVDRIVAA